MSIDVRTLDELLASAPTPEDRLSWFGALLTKESGTRIILVGGSAIEIYLTARAYVSEDIDVVGARPSVAQVLLRWGFREARGRASRTYWVKEGIGMIDLVGPRERSGLPPVRRDTPHGPVWISAVEPLILRRLWRASREGSERLFSQAIALARGRDLDWDYLETMARYEGVGDGLAKLRAELREGRSEPKADATRRPIRTRRPRS